MDERAWKDASAWRDERAYRTRSRSPLRREANRREREIEWPVPKLALALVLVLPRVVRLSGYPAVRRPSPATRSVPHAPPSPSTLRLTAPAVASHPSGCLLEDKMETMILTRPRRWRWTLSEYVLSYQPACMTLYALCCRHGSGTAVYYVTACVPQ